MRVTHKKTGNKYQLLGEVLDTTNSRDGTVAQLYVKDSDDAAKLRMIESLMLQMRETGFTFFVREADEFQEKFDTEG